MECVGGIGPNMRQKRKQEDTLGVNVPCVSDGNDVSRCETRNILDDIRGSQP